MIPHSLKSARLKLTYLPNLAPLDPAAEGSAGAFQLSLDREPVGTISLIGSKHGQAVIGYEIHPGFRRRGLASEAVGAVLNAALGFGLTSLSAQCRSDNAASRGVLENNGFTLLSATPWQVNGDNSLKFMVYQWIAALPESLSP